jgi:hypothetical protein
VVQTHVITLSFSKKAQRLPPLWSSLFCPDCQHALWSCCPSGIAKGQVMSDPVSAKLYLSACYLRDKLHNGNGTEIRKARDRLRNAMAAQYKSGYWKDKPQTLRDYMDLLYRCDKLLVRLGPTLTLANRPKAAFDR